ncbi:uncharacterized protein KQ657_004785 [Scheffersomyces spartinae]|uniref:Uncharacterized protein n=1 Tax=Scheffersomyces spartinae TaxID=45513 RepID=A0A9P7VA36_9ASCO|nr:uncharacterized protein KQ657_004785 [Scheffersomyces spartinae]KAG7194077.1 hypothetical protein KQ657_004785 [Scheffersomyces spartinae]
MVLRHMSSILFNYLSYEYPRPYISHLIFLSLTTNLEQPSLVYNTINQPYKAVKNWQVQKVVDLYMKFPNDDYLKALLVLFQTLDPNLNLSQYTEGGNVINFRLGSSKFNPSIFQYAKHDEYLERLKTVSTNVSIFEENEKVRLQAKTKMDTISLVSRGGRYKRRKFIGGGESHESYYHQLFNPLKTSIVEIQSIKDMLSNFERIACASSNSVLDKPVLSLTKRFERLYMNLNSIGHSDPTLESWFSISKFALEDNSLTYPELVNIVDNLILILRGLVACNIYILVKDFVLGEICPRLSQEEDDDVELKIYLQRLRLVRYLPPKISGNIYENLLDPLLNTLKLRKSSPYWPEVVCSMLFNMKDWFLQMCQLMQRAGGSATPKGSRYFKVINNGLQAIFQFVNEFLISNSALEVDIYILQLLQIFKTIKDEDLHRLEPSAVLLHPSSIYHFLLSCNPLVVSEICGYIARSKAYIIDQEHDIPFRSCRNSIVTDAINFLWRNQGFYYQKDSANKAMLLSPKFLELAQGKLFINDSGVVLFEDVGSLYHNAGFSFLSAQLVWKLEDSEPNITVRHLGPVSTSSISKLRAGADDTEVWLDLTYGQLAVYILNQLDKFGLEGLCDLIFSSVSGLQNQRDGQN